MNGHRAELEGTDRRTRDGQDHSPILIGASTLLSNQALEVAAIRADGGALRPHQDAPALGVKTHHLGGVEHLVVAVGEPLSALDAHPHRFGEPLDVAGVSGEAEEAGVDPVQVGAERGRIVPCRVDGDE